MWWAASAVASLLECLRGLPARVMTAANLGWNQDFTALAGSFLVAGLPTLPVYMLLMSLSEPEPMPGIPIQITLRQYLYSSPA